MINLLEKWYLLLIQISDLKILFTSFILSISIRLRISIRS
jgi:hypothetical protein